MQRAEAVKDIYRKRGAKGLPLERVYRHLFDQELFLRGYGKIYRNFGAMTKGTTEETVDGMSLRKIQTIIDLLKVERYVWTPVRRTEIPKADGRMRPLGIPTWGDKLLQEVIRSILEPYYEQRFSSRSHGFRPNRSCHTALLELRTKWVGTVWFIEGDIKGCFDNIDHKILLEIIRRDIHDGRMLNLIEGLLKAGYMEGWRYHDTLSGTPQGGIISPLLANVYLNDLDRFVERTLIPTYTMGKIRKRSKEYDALASNIQRARDDGELEKATQLKRQRRKLISYVPCDPSYRRLRYLRYADDFLLGFVGPKNEAEDIRRQIGEFLGSDLRLTLSPEKTLITHATDECAKFLGYEVSVGKSEDKLTEGRRATNGKIQLRMPRRVVDKYRSLYSKGGKVIHRKELTADTDYTILQRYQGVYTGIYNYYCMAVNVSKRVQVVRSVLRTSLVKTLASKFKCRAMEIVRRYRVENAEPAMLRVVIERKDKEPLVAIFGGIRLERKPDGLGGIVDTSIEVAWHKPGGRRSEVVQRLMVSKCELCGFEGTVEVHHIRKLADIDRPGRRPKENWEKLMSARKRKTLVICGNCHDGIHAGLHSGLRL